VASLFDVILHTARALEALHEGVATGGSVSTLVDSGLTSFGWQDDDLNNGTVLLIRDASSGGGDEQSRLVSDFTASSGTITVGTNFSIAPAAGDNYGVATKRYPRAIMVGKINETLQELGDIENTTDVTSTGALEYALNQNTYGRIIRIRAGNTGDDPQGWYPVPAYQHAEGKLLFKTAIPDDYTIRVHYVGPHGALWADSDTLNVDINPDWLGIAAALKCARWRLQQEGGDERVMTALINDLLMREAGQRRLRRAWKTNPVNNIFPIQYVEH
jgi:hypothetical protein